MSKCLAYRSVNYHRVAATREMLNPFYVSNR